jgi:hypothetical protein
VPFSTLASSSDPSKAIIRTSFSACDIGKVGYSGMCFFSYISFPKKVTKFFSLACYIFSKDAISH